MTIHYKIPHGDFVWSVSLIDLFAGHDSIDDSAVTRVISGLTDMIELILDKGLLTEEEKHKFFLVYLPAGSTIVKITK